MAMIEAPRKNRQKSVRGMKKSLTEWNTAAPTSGPMTVWMPPVRIIIRKSMDMAMEIIVGSIEPLEKE